MRVIQKALPNELVSAQERYTFEKEKRRAEMSSSVWVGLHFRMVTRAFWLFDVFAFHMLVVRSIFCLYCRLVFTTMLR